MNVELVHYLEYRCEYVIHLSVSESTGWLSNQSEWSLAFYLSAWCPQAFLLLRFSKPLFLVFIFKIFEFLSVIISCGCVFV